MLTAPLLAFLCAVPVLGEAGESCRSNADCEPSLSCVAATCTARRLPPVPEGAAMSCSTGGASRRRRSSSSGSLRRHALLPRRDGWWRPDVLEHEDLVAGRPGTALHAGSAGTDRGQSRADVWPVRVGSRGGARVGGSFVSSQSLHSPSPSAAEKDLQTRPSHFQKKPTSSGMAQPGTSPPVPDDGDFGHH